MAMCPPRSAHPPAGLVCAAPCARSTTSHHRAAIHMSHVEAEKQPPGPGGIGLSFCWHPGSQREAGCAGAPSGSLPSTYTRGWRAKTLLASMEVSDPPRPDPDVADWNLVDAAPLTSTRMAILDADARACHSFVMSWCRCDGIGTLCVDSGRACPHRVLCCPRQCRHWWCLQEPVSPTDLCQLHREHVQVPDCVLGGDRPENRVGRVPASERHHARYCRGNLMAKLW